jgi:hypothetical protein
MSTLAFASFPKDIPDCSQDLNLMPFHIKYSGPAPIDTYFRVKVVEPTSHESTEDATSSTKVPEKENVVEPGESSSQIRSGTNNLTIDVDHSTQGDASHDFAVPTPELEASGSAPSIKQRFVAAFRGRQIHGLKVDAPTGYGGIVLRTGVNGKPGAGVRGGGKQVKDRPSRKEGAARREVVDIDEDADMEDDFHSSISALEPERTLTPSARFNSFVLWNADIPVDEGRDDYMRSLTEWTRLAAVVSSESLLRPHILIWSDRCTA